MGTRLTGFAIAFANAAINQANSGRKLTYGNTWIARKAADMIDRGTPVVRHDGVNNINSTDGECKQRLRNMGFEVV